MKRLANSALCLFLFTSYFIISLIAVFFMVIIRFFLRYDKVLQYKFTLSIKQQWLTLTVTLLGIFFVHPTHIAFDKDLFKKKRCIVLSNHLTNYDWIFVLVILNRLGMYKEVVIILKESLKNIPIYAYGMKTFGYIFLKRDWSKDQEILANGLKKLKEKESFYLLIFPEGTIIDTESHSKSKAFCQKNTIRIDNDMFLPENVLLPRKTGFDMIYSNLDSRVEGIIDITLLTNPYTVYPSEKFDLVDVFLNRSKKVNFCAIIEVYDSDDKTKQTDWLYRLYKEKDDVVNKYRTEQKEIKNLCEFKAYCKNTVRKEYTNYGFDSIYIWSKVSNCYYIILLAAILLSIFMLNR